MCDCFHLAFPNWHGPPGTGAGRRLRGPEPGADDSICDEPSQYTEGERPRPQGSSPVEEYPEKYTDSDKEGDDSFHKGGKKGKKIGFGSLFDKRSTPKMSKLEEAHSPEEGVVVKTAKDGGSEGIIVSGGGKDGIFIKEVVPESPASKTLSVKEGDQILSATVYFDNVSYEDALQILEHAQAYKVKLCLKRKPDITESEPVLQNEAAHGEEGSSPTMRQHGKTKRHSDARISWPKFPSLGRGRKSHFTRSHSSSEADEQRKLELSPTTSDTESPIKTQDALKSKKKHKIKLSGLRKKGRVSTSVDEETDTLTTGPVNRTGSPEASPLQSPDRLESTTGETPQVYMIEDPEVTVTSHLNLERDDQSLAVVETKQHRVELINLDSTLKTTDITAALAAKGSPSPEKSPDGKKKKKKERSELKMRIMGKEKSHKKDEKVQSSPKRLQTLGASVEIAEPTDNEKSAVISSVVSHTEQVGRQTPSDTNTQVINSKSSGVNVTSVPEAEISMPKVDLSLDMSGVGLLRKSPRTGKEKTLKGSPKLSMDTKEKTDTQTAPIFKLPTVDVDDIAMEDTIQKMDVHVKERTTKVKRLSMEGREVKEDPYDRLTERLSKTQLPKREDIEIPGMEDVSSISTTAQGIKEPKAIVTGHVEEIHAETVQLLIDVDRVKEAVSKLPGFKLPKVDTSGMPIPEEITMIDANAQRITVRTHTTPTKVSDAKAKQEAHFSKFDMKGTPVKLPRMIPADLTSHETITETKVEDQKMTYEAKAKAKQIDTEIKVKLHQREDIVIRGKESTQQAAHLQAQKSEEAKEKEDIALPSAAISITERDTTITEEIVLPSLKGSDKKSKKAKMPGFGIAKPDIRFPDIGIDLPKRNLSEPKVDTVKEDSDILVQEMKKSKTEPKLSKDSLPSLASADTLLSADIPLPLVKSKSTDSGKQEVEETIVKEESKKEKNIKGSPSRPKLPAFKLPKFGYFSMKGKEEIAGVRADVTISETKTPTEDISKITSIDGSPAKTDADLVDMQKSPEKTSDVVVTVPEIQLSVTGKAPSLDSGVTGELTVEQDNKFKLPKFGVSFPKVKGFGVDLHASKPKADVSLTDDLSKPEKEVPEIDASLPNVDISLTDGKIETEKDGKAPERGSGVKEVDIEGQGNKFKLPKFGISLPKVKGPEIDLSLSKKNVDVPFPEVKADIQLPDVDVKKHSAEVEIKALEGEVQVKDVELKNVEESPSKFKMPSFKLPKFGGATPHTTEEVPYMDEDIHIDRAAVDITVPNIEIEGPSLDVKSTGAELEGKGGKFKMPRFGISMPKVKGPEIDVSLSKKDVDVTLPEAKAEVKLPDVEIKEPSAKVEIKAPEIEVEMKDAELKGSPSTFKMPSFKLPKFGIATSKVIVEVPDVDKDIHIDGAEIKTSEDGANIDITVPSLDIEGPSLDVKSTGAELEGKGGKFKMPSLGISMPKVKGPEIDVSLSKRDVDVTLPEAKAEVKLPDVEIKEPSAQVEIKAPEIEVEMKDAELKGSPSKFKMPSFKLPKFGIATSKVIVEVPDVDKDIHIDGAEIKTSKDGANIDITVPSLDIEGPSLDVKSTGAELEGKGGKFKMPSLGISMPKVKGPEIDVSLSKRDVDVTLPEAKAEVKLPDVEIKEPSAQVEIKAPEIEVEMEDAELKGSPSKFKMPSFKLPKFGAATPNVTVEVPEVDKDIHIDGAEIKTSEDGANIDITVPSLDIEGPSLDVKSTGAELEGKGGKFKMPGLGISMPKVKGPEIDVSLSKKDVDVTLPEAKAEVKLPDVEVKEPSAEPPAVELDAKLKKPRFSLPRFSFSKPSVKGPEVDVNLPDVDVSLPEGKVEVKEPELDIKAPEIDVELDGQGSKFKMPSFGISLPTVKGPEIDLSLAKKDVDVTLPEAKAQVKLPDVEIKEPSAKVEIKAPEIEAEMKDAELKGSPSKFKMPSFKLPKFGAATPNVTVEVPEVDKDIHIYGAEIKTSKDGANIDITVPSLDIEGPSLDVKSTGAELEGKGGKFKMPSLSISMPKVKGPEIDVSLSKKDVDVTLPEAKAGVKLPDVEVKEPSAEPPAVELDAKLKKPRFSLPRFSFSKPSVKGPEVDVNLPDVDVSLPEGKVEVKEPELDIKAPEIDVELDGQGSKFKMPSFGISLPTVKGPEIDLSLAKKDVDVTLPEAKAQVKLPDVEIKEPSAKVEIKAPEIEVEMKDAELKGSPSKFKMPSFKLPKFGAATPNVTVEVPEVDKDIHIDGAEIKTSKDGANIDITVPSLDIEGPSLDVKSTGAELEGKGGKFKMPSLGISMPKVKGPEIDVSLSKKDVDVTLPEAKAEVKLPDVEVKEPSAEPPAVELDTKLKRPRFSLPRFSFSKPSVKGPEVDVNLPDVDVSLPEGKVEVKEPELDIKAPDIDVELDGQGSKFKMPSFGISLPTVKGPEIDLSLAKKDVDVTLPEVKAEVKLPEVEIKEPSAKVEIKAPEIEVEMKDAELKGSPSKFKMPSFKLPKFGAATPNVTVEVPEVDKDIHIDGAEIKTSEDGANIDITVPSLDIEGPSLDVKSTGAELEGKGGKFKMPSLGISMPKVKGPEIDVSLSKKDVDVTLPEAKAEVKLPDVEVKEPSAEPPAVELDAKLKKPRFSLPRFSFSKPSVKGPEVDVNLPDVDVSLPEGKVEVKEPELDIKAPEIDVELDGQGSKFKMPSFGISLPTVKGPEIDLSLTKKDVDVTLPEAKAEVKLPDVEIKEPSAKIEIKAPEIEVEMKDAELKGSPSKFKMPSFKLPKFGAATPNVTVEVPEVDKDIHIDGAEIKTSKDGANIDITVPSLDIEGPSLHVKSTGAELEGKGGKFKMPSLGTSMPKVKGPEIDVSLSKKDVDVTLPEAKAEVKLPDVEVKEPSVEPPAVELDAKLKKPRFSLPRFSFSKPSVKGPEVDVNLPDVDVSLPEGKVEVKEPELDIKAPEIDVELDGQGSKFKMPSFGISLPIVKGPEIDLSLAKKDVDVTLPEAKAEVQLPDVEVPETSAAISVPEAPEIEVDAKMKKTSWSLPRFSFSKSSAKAPEVDVNLPHEDVSLPEGKVEVKEPELEIKPPEVEVELKDTEGSPSKFKMPTFKLPTFGAATPSVTVEVPDVDKDINIKGPEIDLNFLKKDVDITLPEAKAEVKLPDVEAKGPSAAISVQEAPSIEVEAKMKKSSWSMPRFSFSKASVKGPEVDVNLPQVDISLPEGKVEVKEPEVEIKAPEVEVQLKDVEGSPSKFKMPTFKLPKFGAATPNVTVELPDMDKDIKIDGAELKIPKDRATVDITAPTIDIEGPSIDVKSTGAELEGKGGKFKMPSLGLSMPKVKGPEIDLSSSKTDVDVTLPEVKAEVKLPDVKVKEASAEPPAVELEAKLKKPRFSLPRFSFSKPSVKEPEVDVNLPDVDVSLPEGRVEVKEPELDIKAPETDLELDGQGSKFKMPSFGISLPKVKGPEIDLSLAKKDVDVTLPEAKAEVSLPDVEVPETSAAISVPEAPAIEAEAKFKKPSFSMPRFSFSKPSVKAPEVDVNLPDVDVSLPEGKLEVTQPEVEIKAPEIEVQPKNVDGSPSKVKMPTFKLPKLAAGTPNVTVELPDVDMDINIDAPEIKTPKDGANIDITIPSLDIEGPSIDVKSTGAELEGKGGKLRIPSLGLSMPKVKEPEIDLRSSKKDADVTLPEVKAEVKLPDVEVKEPSIEPPAVELEAKLKKPRFSLPRFSFSKPSVKEPEVDVNLPDVDVSLPEAKVEVKEPELDIKAPEIDVELDGQGSKFKMPSFGISLPKVKGPEIDLSLAKKDVDVTLPEAKAEVQLPDVEVPETSAAISVPEAPSIEVEAKMKKSSWSMPRFSFSKASVKGPEVDVNLPQVDVSLPEGKVEVKEPELDIKAPEIEVELKDTEGSPSKFKMPTFKLPKFGAATQNITEEIPELEKDINIKAPEIKTPEKGAIVDITVPSVDIEGPSMDVKSTEAELEGKGSKFKMPNLGLSMPKVKGPEISLSKKDTDVTLPEAKAQAELPDVEVKVSSAAISVPDASTIEVEAKLKKSSRSMPRFSFSKQSAKAPEVDTTLEGPEVDATLPEVKTEIILPDVEVKEPSGAILVDEPPPVELDVKLKKPRFSLPRFSFSKPSVKEPEADVNLPEVDVSLTEGKVEVKKPEVVGVEVKQPIAEVEPPEGEAELKDILGSPSRFKMATFKLPKFGATTPNITVEVPYVDKDIHIEGAELRIPEEDAAVDIKVPSVDINADVSNTDHPKQETVAIDSEMPKTETDSPAHGSPSKFKLPSFKMPRLSFSKSKPEDEHVPVPADTEHEDDHLEIQVEPQGPGKSPKLTLTSFGEILKTIDVEFDVPAKDEDAKKLTPSKEKVAVTEPKELSVQSVAELQPAQKEDEVAEMKSKPRFKFPELSFSRSPEESGALASANVAETTGAEKGSEGKEKETNIKQESSKSPERVGWLKFPKVGLSSPSEPAKIAEKEEHESEKSPVGDTLDDDVSTTYSLRSSDAFADISSTMTSEQVGLSLSSPTKITVKYSDPNANVGLGEVHGNVVTSTTRTELISVEPNLPEKVTILSSRESSSSVDTLKLEPGNIHVISSNIQATPEVQHATRLTDFHVESTGGLSLKPEFKDGASWSVEESHHTESGKRTIIQKHVVRETSGENRETVVITKKVTHVFGVESSEPISGETASSIRRLKDSVHYDKIKFFEDAQK